MPEIIRVVAFLLWCNFLPPLANFLLHERLSFPLDANKKWFDGLPVLGPHKTYRGVVAAIGGAVLASPVLGAGWQIAAICALLSMSGDLLTSFIKRRFRLQSGESAPILDQFFEGLFPLLYLKFVLPLSWSAAGIIFLLFIPITHGGSWLWHFLLFRPPPENYPRLVRSAVRFREWRACHLPLARWQKLFNFENVLYYRLVIGTVFQLAGLYRQGKRNALELRLRQVSFQFANLPASFDNFTILFMTDLHLDGLDGLTEKIIEQVRDMEVDLCIVGGDLRMEMYGAIAPAIRQLRKLLEQVKSRHGIIGVLGNHDCIEMVPDLEDAGMMLLINDSYAIEKKGEKIWLAGVDDPHFYKVHNVDMAFRDVPDSDFVIFVAHSPEAYEEASAFAPELYLCGHTHGGQIRLPGRGPLFTHCRAPRSMAAGIWQAGGMTGYTSCGVGSSGVPLRFNCPPEITLITLRNKH